MLFFSASSVALVGSAIGMVERINIGVSFVSVPGMRGKSFHLHATVFGFFLWLSDHCKGAFAAYYKLI
jgi:hypothetical protein